MFTSKSILKIFCFECGSENTCHADNEHAQWRVFSFPCLAYAVSYHIRYKPVRGIKKIKNLKRIIKIALFIHKLSATKTIKYPLIFFIKKFNGSM